MIRCNLSLYLLSQPTILWSMPNVTQIALAAADTAGGVVDYPINNTSTFEYSASSNPFALLSRQSEISLENHSSLEIMVSPCNPNASEGRGREIFAVGRRTLYVSIRTKPKALGRIRCTHNLNRNPFMQYFDESARTSRTSGARLGQ